MWAHRLILAPAVVAAISLAACSYFEDEPATEKSAPQTAAAESAARRFAPWNEENFVYRLQVGDEIEVVHPITNELDRTVSILPDGRIYLPIVGGVVAADQSPGELKAQLENAYSRELREPSVTVIPTKIGSQKVYVGGEVVKPGVYDFTGSVGVVEAIFTAGGLKNSANDEEVVVLRRTKDNLPMMRTLNMDGILTGSKAVENIVLRQFDVVFVPRTTAAEIGVWVEQNITNILPFGRSFSYTLQRNVNGGLF